jgi:teichuronic acid biosynthesis glycosyltransferase TuaG
MKKKNKDLVSIIIPYYKKKFFFKQSFLSAYNQSYKHKEIIIIYDDPNRSDLSYIQKILKKKKNIKLIVNKINQGVGEARNIGIKNSKGNYIAFLDSDDIWDKHKLRYQLDFMKKNNFMATFTSYKIIDDKNKVIGSRIAKKVIDFKALIYSCDIGLSTVLLNRKVLKMKLKFPKIKTKEDFVLWLKISKNFDFYGLNKKLSHWRKLEHSLSSNTFQKIKDGFRVYFIFMKFNILKSIFFLIILSLNYLKKNIRSI